jgi:tetratricopeptide (TPR) repeat protein
MNGSAALALVLLEATVARGASMDELRARAKSVSDPAEALTLTRTLRRAGFVAEAVMAAQRGFAKAQGNELVADIRLELARAYIDQRLSKKALRECDQLHKLVRFKEQLCIAEAQLLGRRGSTALPAAEQALALVPTDYDAIVAKGRALMQLGKPQEAESVLRDALAKAPARPEAYRYLGELMSAQSKQPEAIAMLRDGRRAVPDDPDVLALLGALLPEGVEARDVLQQALAARPTFAAARARLGVVLTKLGDLDGAEKMLREALQADARQAEWNAALGEVYVAKKEPELALKSAHEALKIVPNHGLAKLVEAQALALKGDIDLAIEAFEAAYGFTRLNPDVLVEGARACVRAGRLTTAKAFADRATGDFPKAGAAWEAAGDVAVALKEKDVARQAYGKAVAGEGPVDKDAIRRKLASLK